MSNAILSPHPGGHGPCLAYRPLQTNWEGSDVLRASYPLLRIARGCDALASVQMETGAVIKTEDLAL